jgi:hypothetical protein
MSGGSAAIAVQTAISKKASSVFEGFQSATLSMRCVRFGD